MNWLSLAPYLLALAIGAGGAWPIASGLARAPLQSAVADLRKENTELREGHAEAVRLASLAVADRLQRAQAAGEKASQRLATALAANNQLSLEKSHALKAATSGRACLSERTVRVLNSTASEPAAGGAAAGLPAPASQPAAAPSAVASDPAFISDRDVAEWIAGAQRQYSAVSAQLNALIDWVAEQPAEAEPTR